MSLLADLVADWDDAAGRGPGGVRPGGRRRRSGRRSRRRPAARGRSRSATGRRRVPADGRRRGAVPAATLPCRGPSRAARRPTALPTRPRAADPARPTRPDLPRGRRASVGRWPPTTPTRSRPCPDEARARIVADAAADAPGRRRPGHRPACPVRGRAAPDRLVSAMEAFKALLRDRPGATRVVIHVPAPGGGAALPMELRRGVAYDAELLAEVRRRLGEGLVDLRLAGVTDDGRPWPRPSGVVSPDGSRSTSTARLPAAGRRRHDPRRDPGRRSILDLGAGTGRFARALRRPGSSRRSRSTRSRRCWTASMPIPASSTVVGSIERLRLTRRSTSRCSPATSQ